MFISTKPKTIKNIAKNCKREMFSWKTKYPNIVTKTTDIAIHKTFVIAIPSYCKDRAKKRPAPPKQTTVKTKNNGFL